MLAACGGVADPNLADRVTQLERRLDAEDAQQQRLLATLREHGIVFHPDPPKDAAESMARALEDLELALARLESAKETQDNAKGQSAMAALETALQTLRQDPAAAMKALMAKAEAAAPAQQASLLECYARVGGAAAAPELRAIATATQRPPGLRVAAARSLIEVDARTAIPAVASLLQEATPLPELYLLVHMLAGTGVVEVVPVLAAALQQNRDRSVRCHAATGLGNFKTGAAVEALAAAAMGDEYPAVRTNALRALARAGAPERLREVAEHVRTNDPDSAVRAVAAELVSKTGR